MRTAVRVFLSFVIGFVITYVVVVAAAFAYMSAGNVIDRDGGMSMGIIFMIGPAAGILGGIAAAVAIPLRLARRDLASASATPATAQPPRLPAAVRAVIAAVIGFFIAYVVSWFAARLVFGSTFSTYQAALAVVLVPYGIGVLAAAYAALRVLRTSRRAAVPTV